MSFGFTLNLIVCGFIRIHDPDVDFLLHLPHLLILFFKAIRHFTLYSVLQVLACVRVEDTLVLGTTQGLATVRDGTVVTCEGLHTPVHLLQVHNNMTLLWRHDMT